VDYLRPGSKGANSARGTAFLGGGGGIISLRDGTQNVACIVEA
jgi:hypothetical protein